MNDYMRYDSIFFCEIIAGDRALRCGAWFPDIEIEHVLKQGDGGPYGPFCGLIYTENLQMRPIY